MTRAAKGEEIDSFVQKGRIFQFVSILIAIRIAKKCQVAKLGVRRHLAYVVYVELTVPLLSFNQHGATILITYGHYTPCDLSRILVLLFLC